MKGEGAPTDTRSPGQYLHPGLCGDCHRVQGPPPCPHAELAALCAAADPNPDVVRPQTGGVKKKWGEPGVATCAYECKAVNEHMSAVCLCCMCTHAHACGRVEVCAHACYLGGW